MISKYPPIIWIDVLLKVVLVCLLLFGAFSGLPQFEGKGFLWRLITYPMAMLVLPVAWTAWRRDSAYPFAADILITLPFLIDTAGNSLDLYDTVEWWDDANHLVNWALLSGGVGALVSRLGHGFWISAALVIGFGATTAIIWEIAEYVAFIRVSPELETAYIDTLGDMTLGLIGSVVAGVISGWASRRLQSRPVP
ncbi:MAG: hypothetical protein OXN21_08505 [Chloroflexota bacterium]|nr:hypothetical protein [Chloroflexota bacterium]